MIKSSRMFNIVKKNRNVLVVRRLLRDECIQLCVQLCEQLCVQNMEERCNWQIIGMKVENNCEIVKKK